MTGANHEIKGGNSGFRRHEIGMRHFIRRQQNMRWKVSHAALDLKAAENTSTATGNKKPNYYSFAYKLITQARRRAQAKFRIFVTKPANAASFHIEIAWDRRRKWLSGMETGRNTCKMRISF